MKSIPQPIYSIMKFIIAVLALVHLTLSDVTAAQTNSLPGQCCAKLDPAARLSDNSLFHLDSTWTNDASRTVKLASLQGRPQVVTMFFSTCAYACPILVHDMKRIEA